MSQESGDGSVEFEEAYDWLSKWYHIPVVVGLFVFMFWARARTWGQFLANGEVYYRGNDAWYHLRQVEYTIRHWPQTMPFEAWTNYPTGTFVAQFGTIYDQLVATVALIVGLGSPSTRTVEMIHLFAPAVVGALIVIPTYYLGKRVGKSTFSGVLAAVIVALSTGSLLSRSLVGFSDHHAAEAFTQALAALTIVVALQVADSEKPVWELLVDRDVAGLRRPIGYAVLAGFATTLYMWVWPPGVLLIGILGLYVTIQASIDHVQDSSPEPVLIVAAVIFLVTTVLMLLPLDRADISTVKFSLIQPGLAVAGAAWCGVLAAISRTWDDRSYPVWTYPILAFGLIGAAVVGLLVVSPNTFGLLLDQFFRIFGRLVGQSPSTAASTVGEISPLRNPQQTLLNWYGFTHIIAIVGVLLALVRQTVTSNRRSELLFVSLWLVVIFSASYTQARFSYYLTVPVAIMATYALGTAFSYIVSSAEDASVDVSTYQVLTVVTILMLVIAPMVLVSYQGRSQDVLTQSEGNPKPTGVLGWDSSLDWMSENTPAVGNFQGAGNNLSYWGEYRMTDDFDYEAGTYGVLSWWDYGHWITAEGERIPVANPFQESATEAAKFLIAQDESRANEVVETNMTEGDNAETRYVMVDWKMATANADRRLGGGKFFAPSAFVEGVSQSDFYNRVTFSTQGGTRLYFTLQNQAYYDTMVNRLYRYHGSAAWPDYVPNSAIGGLQTPPQFSNVRASPVPVTKIPQASGEKLVQFLPNLQAAQRFVEGNATARIGGISKYPSEHVPALQHYRLVQTSDAQRNPIGAIQPGLQYLGSQQIGLPLQYIQEPYSSWTKVFERVPGATIEGTAPDQSNETVYATVNMRIPNSNKTFTYMQQATTDQDGAFTMTVPYSTTGYDNWGTAQGHTNVSVRAVSDYSLSTKVVPDENMTEGTFYNASIDVSEAKVIGEDTAPVEVTLDRSTIDLTQQNETGNVTDGTNETTGGTNETSDGTNETTGENTTTDSTSSMAPLAGARYESPQIRVTG